MNTNDDDGDDGGEWDNVDWEDADADDDSKNDDDDDDDDSNNEEDDAGSDDNPFPSRGVMIDFGKNTGKSNNPDVHTNDDECNPQAAVANAVDVPRESSSSSSIKRKRKATTRILRNIPHETQLLIQNVRRTLLLCNVYKCAFWSSIATTVDSGSSEWDDDNDDRRRLLINLAYSLIPQQFHNYHLRSNNDNDDDDDDDDDDDNDDAMMTTIRKSSSTNNNYNSIIPTKCMVQEFATWCIAFLNEAGERRRLALHRNIAQGATAAMPATSPPKERGGERKQQCRGDGIGLKGKKDKATLLTNNDSQKVNRLDNPTKLNSNTTIATTDHNMMTIHNYMIMNY
jgi:hypothetical protein